LKKVKWLQIVIEELKGTPLEEQQVEIVERKIG
jgi:S-adenosylmethionine synthetase